ncbi:shikimate dehydrogenase [Lawsonibacter celer]|jgi:shikimate dehydrogenase|uniref:shikimate dehydrogenase n=1 Tax=Lawsonibacter celer TaxID=2986526 RepID=UPI0016465E8E|nr:shikimate dehydrogenase [Lawsonibacter celer]
MQVELKNTTKKLCVIGEPVLHSKSPVIQNAMIQALGLDYIYLCQPVPRGACRQWLELAAFAGYAGFNATMPHKQELVALMDELDEDARLFGAVNTVCLRDGRAYGHNTDGEGFLRALADEEIFPEGRRVVVLGAGGAAKAVVLKLMAHGAEVTVCNRTEEKARLLHRYRPKQIRTAGFTPAQLRRAAEGCDLLINCTSLGMSGTAGQFEDFSFLDGLKEGVSVVDLIYAPEETRLLAEARARGHRTANGMGLLVHQAVLSLEHFTGVGLDAGAMKPVIARALGGKADKKQKKP